MVIQDHLNDKHVQLPEDADAILHSLNTPTPFFIKKSGLGLTEPPKDEAWHSVVRMQLANNKLSELPLSPSSPELKVLMLQGNVELTRIPNRFFCKMPLLSILDLSYTSVRELPDSFFELEQLREMYLRGCECFMKLSPKIGKLKKLEKLDLDGTQIIHLPEEIQELTNLQSLFLCLYEYRGRKGKQYTSSTIIPSEVISKLKGLKHLRIDVNPDDERWYENVRGILPEILGLEHLLTLSLYIPHLELLKAIPDYIFQVDFRFTVGRHMKRIISSTTSTCEEKFKQSGCSLKFVNGDVVPNEIKRFVRHSKALFLERHKKIKSLSEFKMMNLEQLRICMLAECREMQTIVDGRQSNSDNDVFSQLLYLYVSHMKSLRSIWEGPVPPRCFLGLLKSLELQNCLELTTIFSMDFLGNLSLLKELIVRDCPKITTLISDGSFKHKGEVFLPKLRKISLLHLLELITISNGCYIGPSLYNMAIYDCPKLQSLSRLELSSQTLKVIKGEIKWWDQLQWSKEEWGISQRPSKFECIFSSIDNQVDIMTQFGNDGVDIDDDADMTSVQTLFERSKQNANSFSSIKQNANRVAFRVSSVDIVDEGYKWRKYGLKTKGRSKNKRRDEAEKTLMVPAPRFGSTEIPLDDGFIWRKYGRRDILGSIYPRNYFRCTHWNLYRCPARKKVQRLDSNPNIFAVTYRGRHTCHLSSTARSSSPQLISGKTGEIVTRETLDPSNEKVDKDRRDYYRCSYEGCPVKKRVQRCEEDPTIIEIGYEGEQVHTCPQNNRSHHELQSIGGIVSELLQSSSATNSSVNNHVDMRTRFGVDDIDASSVNEPLRPSNDEVLKDIKHSRTRGSNSTWTEQSESTEDGYGWKKYDQRETFGAKCPKEYFRCTHRNNEGCLATKQVQRIDKEPRDQKGTQTSTVNSSMHNQIDLSTRSGVDDDHVHNHPTLKSTALRRPSGMRIITDRKQIANRSNRRSDICTEASPVTNPARLYSITPTVASDLESFSSMGGRIEPSANENYEYGVDTN